MKRWIAEVVSERKPPPLELAALRDTLPALAKAIITLTSPDE